MNKFREIEDCKDRKIGLPAEAGVLVGDDIYFFSSEYNLLYKIHLPDFSVLIISRIPCSEITAFEWFRKMRHWNNKLILIPSYAEKIWIYDLKRGIWDNIAIDYAYIGLKFWGAVIYQDNIFLFGIKYPAILKIDLNNHHVSYIKVELSLNQEIGEKGLFFRNAVIVNNLVLCPVSISNNVLRFNLDSFEYEWMQIGHKDNQYSGIDYDGNYFWISPGRNGKIVKWDGNSKWEEFDVPEEIAHHAYKFVGVICDGEIIRFLAQEDGKSLEIIKEDSDKIQIMLTEDTKYYVHFERYEDGTIALMQSNGYLDVKWKGKWIKGISQISYKVFKEYIFNEVLQNSINVKRVLNEEEMFREKDFIRMVIERQNYVEKIHKSEDCLENTVGEKIYSSQKNCEYVQEGILSYASK